MAVNIIKLSSPETQEFWKIPVLFEDDVLLAVDKPALVLTSPDRDRTERPNLMAMLHRDIKRAAPWSITRGVTYLATTHRLDFETSGVLLLAKTKSTLVNIANQFGIEHQHKTFWALVEGTPSQDEFTMDAKLSPHPLRVGQMQLDVKHGKRATTHVRVLERFQRHTWIECRPTTDRTHQIRFHLQHAAVPLAGDSLYGGHQLLLSKLKRDFRLKHGQVEHPLISRVALHLSELTVAHPVSGQTITISAPIPHDLAVALKFLRKYAPLSQPSSLVIPSFPEITIPSADDEQS